MTLFKPTKPLAMGEFVALMALMTALVALAIDAMLPALSQIGAELKASNANDVQLVVGVLFFGLGVGQLFFGPLSDSVGRKPAIYIGLAVYLLGCLISMLAQDFNTMLFGRLLQGLGLSGPRVVSMALIRDQYSGRQMARVMSFIMIVFIFVPALAPSVGQLVLWLADWRAIFALLMVLGVMIWLWLASRQPETLKPELRREFKTKVIISGFVEVCKQPVAIGYTIATGVLSGAFVAFLSTSQQIIQVQYQAGERFPLLFACLALCLGLAAFVNGRIVLRYGMRIISRTALLVVTFLSASFLVATTLFLQPTLLQYMIFLGLVLFFVGLVFGNMTSIAMEPLGHLAGVGAAVVGAFSTIISVILAVTIGSFYTNTVTPLVIGFAVCSAAALLISQWADRHHQETN